MGADHSLDKVHISKQAAVGDVTLKRLDDDWERTAGSKKKSIDYQQFSKLMQNLPESDMKALFELYDINHNNLISWKEYVCTVVLVMNGTVEEKLALLFNAFDENRDNEITFQEFKDAVSKFSKEESKNDEFLNLVFQQADHNGDNAISFKEFKEFLDADKAAFARVVGILGKGLGV